MRCRYCINFPTGTQYQYCSASLFECGKLLCSNSNVCLAHANRQPASRSECACNVSHPTPPIRIECIYWKMKILNKNTCIAATAERHSATTNEWLPII